MKQNLKCIFQMKRCRCQRRFLGFLPTSLYLLLGFPYGWDGKESACNAGDLGLIPGSGRSPGEEKDNPLQYCVWRIPWMEEPGRLQTVRSQRIGHDLATNTRTLALSSSLSQPRRYMLFFFQNLFLHPGLHVFQVCNPLPTRGSNSDSLILLA